MRREGEAMKPKYLDEVIKRLQAQEPGVYEATVFHDDWCDLLSGEGPCNCEPEVGPAARVVWQ